MTDSFGPQYRLRLYDPRLGMEGFVVIDNTALGPGKGGLRMTPAVNEGEVFRLARAMTWKNALAGLPFGGAKSGIVWRGGSVAKKKKFVTAFAQMLEEWLGKKYIAGPDVATGEREMEWLAAAAGSRRAATGKPRRLGGLPHELGSTGFGVAHAVRVALELKGIPLDKARVAIEGFGNVGSFTARYLDEWGAKIIAVADSKSAVFAEAGLRPAILQQLKARRLTVGEYPAGQRLSREEFWALEATVLVPASVTDVINEQNKNLIRAAIIAEGANIPMPETIEEELHRRGILIVPDFVANAGGVISSYAEWRGWGTEKMFALVEEKITRAVRRVLGRALKTGQWPRRVALDEAARIVGRAMKRQ